MKKLVAMMLVLLLVCCMIPAAMADGDVITIRTIHYMVEGDKAAGMTKIQDLFAEKVLK